MRVGPSVAHLDKEPSKWPWEQKRFPKIGNLYFLFDIEIWEQNSMERIGNHRFLFTLKMWRQNSFKELDITVFKLI